MSEGVTISFNADTDAASAKIQEFLSGVTEKLDRLAGVGEFFQNLGTRIAEAFTLGAIVEQFAKAIESAEEFGEAVKKTALSVQALNALKFLSEETHSPAAFEDLVGAVALLNDKIFMAVRLGGEAARSFNDLGISLTNDRGEILSTETVLGLIMDRFHGLENGVKKNAAAMELFGRSGRDMIPLLNEGSQALEQLKSKGGGITPEMIEQAEQFNRSWVQLKNTWQQIFLDASEKILPTLQRFSDSLRTGAESEGRVASASSALVAVFNSLVSVITVAKTGLDNFLEALTAVSATIDNVFKVSVGGLVKLFSDWHHAIVTVLTDLHDLGSVSLFAGMKMIEDVGHGNFKQALSDLKSLASFAKGEGVDSAQAFKSTWTSTWSTIGSAAKVSWSIAKDNANIMLDSVAQRWDKMSDTLKNIWHPQKKDKALEDILNSGGEKSASAPAGPASVPQSEEFKKMLEQLNKELAEASQGKLALLDQERASIDAKLAQEAHSYEEYNKAREENDRVYAAKRLAIVEQEENARRELAEKNLQLAQQRIQSDPTLGESEKTEQILPLLEQQLQLTQQNIQALQQSEATGGLNDERKLQAEKQLVQLKEQELKINQQIQQINSADFTGQMRQGLTQLQDQWGNLGQNLAHGTLDAIQKGVDGISTSIMGALEHTRSWGAAFQQIGRSIIASIIQIVVQWVASMTIIAALKKLFGTQDETQATSQASAWAPAAIAASIATEGSAAAIGAGAFTAALAAGTAIAGALGSASSATGAYASGGVVPGGKQLIWVNEAGQEAVLNARALATVGHNFVNALNSGLPATQGGVSAAAAAIPRPITSDGTLQKMMQEQAQQVAAGAGGVNVQGHRLTAIFPSSRQEMLDVLKSAEGEKIVVDHAKRRRIDIGVKS